MSNAWHIIVAAALAVWAWCCEHPTIAWPVAIAAISFGFDRLESRFPNIVALLRATGQPATRASCTS